MPNFGNDSQREKAGKRRTELPERGAGRGPEPSVPTQFSDAGHLLVPSSLYEDDLHPAPSGALAAPVPSPKGQEQLSPLWEGLSFPAFLLQCVSFWRGSAACRSLGPALNPTPSPPITERKCNPCVWDRVLLTHHNVSLSRRLEVASLRIPWDAREAQGPPSAHRRWGARGLGPCRSCSLGSTSFLAILWSNGSPPPLGRRHCSTHTSTASLASESSMTPYSQWFKF